MAAKELLDVSLDILLGRVIWLSRRSVMLLRSISEDFSLQYVPKVGGPLFS